MRTLEDAHAYLESKGFYIRGGINGKFLRVVSSLTGPDELGFIRPGDKIGRSLRIGHTETGWQVTQMGAIGPVTSDFPDLAVAVDFAEEWLSEIFE